MKNWAQSILCLSAGFWSSHGLAAEALSLDAFNGHYHLTKGPNYLCPAEIRISTDGQQSVEVESDLIVYGKFRFQIGSEETCHPYPPQYKEKGFCSKGSRKGNSITYEQSALTKGRPNGWPRVWRETETFTLEPGNPPTIMVSVASDREFGRSGACTYQ